MADRLGGCSGKEKIYFGLGNIRVVSARCGLIEVRTDRAEPSRTVIPAKAGISGGEGCRR
jgi:hypothetical protein